MANEKRLDLIDRGEVMKTLEKYVNPMPGEHGDGFLSGLATAMDVIEAAQRVDAAPVVHGRWFGKEEKLWNIEQPIVTGWECSECGVWGHYTLNYCPNCGAKMDGDWSD